MSAPLGSDELLALVDGLSDGLRAGTDARAVLYAWRRCGGDEAGFRQAIADLLAARCFRIRDGHGKRLLLAEAGLARLRERLGDAAPPAEDDDEDARERDAMPAPPAPLPRHDPEQALLRIVAVIAAPLPRGTPIHAGTLRRIWEWERLRAADLRRAIGALRDRGLLELAHDGARAAVVATAAGHAAMAEFAA